MSVARGWRWLLVLLWVSFIIYMSSHSVPPGDPIGRVGEFLADLGVKTLIPGTSLKFSIAKVGHILEYALLGILLLAASWGNIHKRIWATVGIGLAVAIIDETRQYFVPGREAHIRDVFIDLFGIAFGLTIALGLRRMYLNRVGRVPSRQALDPSEPRVVD